MTLKTCNKCNESKSIDNFFKDKNNLTDGHYSICKTCKKLSTMKWRFENKEIYNESQRKAHKLTYARDRLYRYKLTVAEHAAIIHEQKGVCAVCNKYRTAKRELAIDHNPNTGEVRGILCYGCNRLQRIFDVLGLLDKFIAYNANPPARKILNKINT